MTADLALVATSLFLVTALEATFFAGIFFAADFLPAVFFVATLVTATFFGTAFFVATFFAATFFADTFFGAAFFAATFLATVCFEIGFFAGNVLREPPFSAGARLATGLRLDFTVERVLADLPTAFFAAALPSAAFFATFLTVLPACAAEAVVFAVDFVAGLRAAGFFVVAFFICDTSCAAKPSHADSRGIPTFNKLNLYVG